MLRQNIGSKETALILLAVYIEQKKGKAEPSGSLVGDFFGMSSDQLDKITAAMKGVTAASIREARDWLEKAEKNGVEVVTSDSPYYPRRLLEISESPLVLFVRASDEGMEHLLRRNEERREVIAVVGSRQCSDGAREVSRNMARGILLRGGVVVSGLALGVDQAALEGAVNQARWCLRQGQRVEPPVAIIGSGILRLYPTANRALAEAMVAVGGAVISEYGLYTSAQKFLFPRRNRIVSGMADKVVVVEARAKSGALITARLAGEQGRDVFAVPGYVGFPGSMGSNELLKQGAIPCTGPDDLFSTKITIKQTENDLSLQDIDSPSSQSPEQKSAAGGKFSKRRGELLAVQRALAAYGPMTMEYLMRQTSLPLPILSEALALLELEGGIFRKIDGRYSLDEFD